MTRRHFPGHSHHSLVHDLHTLALSRRRVLHFLGGAVLIPLVGSCTSDDTASPDAGTTGPDASGSTACAQIPEETAGPYPGDGTNGVNALTTSGIVRSDLRSSFGGLTGTADGVVLTLTLTIVDAAASCAPLAGRAVYLWHCDRDGNYSLYSPAAAAQNYLRGVQQTDADGRVTFTTIFPGCYAGRWPHLHFEVYPSLAVATRGTSAAATSQIAVPKAACDEVYATAAYASSATNLPRMSLASDLVFNDGVSLETPAISGSPAAGYALAMQVAI